MKEQVNFKINNFDLLRFLAATQVIADHYIEHYNIHITPLQLQLLNLFPGVPVFFVISGYLISASYERNSNLKEYFKNRVLRIFPGLWCCVFLTIILFSITGVSFFNKQVIAWLPCQLAGLIYTPQFLKNFGFGSYNGSLWTIPLELQFYIILPIFYKLIPKNKLNNGLIVFLVIFSLCNIGYQLAHFSGKLDKLMYYSFVPNIFLFLMGVVFQRYKLYNSKLIYNKAHYWVALYLVISLVITDYFVLTYVSLFINFSLAICVISLAYTLPDTAKKILRGNDISYGIYIYHGLILSIVMQEKLSSWVNIYVLIGLTYIVAYLSWILVEKPFIQLKKKTIKATIE
jgi:peptidoglycan/LPS O-acetylase OafA/YrhL